MLVELCSCLSPFVVDCCSCVVGAPHYYQRGHGNAVLSASLDGTVRAFDLTRYRNFRTLTAPTPTQFISLAVDQSGVCVRVRSKRASESLRMA